MAFKFVKGSDVDVVVQILDAVTKVPFNLAGYTSATGFFPKDDEVSSVPITNVTVMSQDLGKLRLSLTDADTAQLLAGGTNFQVTVDQGTKRTIVLFENSIEILAPFF